MEKKLILHITPRSDWEQAILNGVYTADSLAEEGFIHCSTPEQVLGTANAYFEGRKDLVILWIDPAIVTSEIRWELSDGKIFPHIYGALNLDAVVGEYRFRANTEGIFVEIPG